MAALYSFDIGGVHFVCGQLAAGDTTYCESNMQWIADDLKKYASAGECVIFFNVDNKYNSISDNNISN